MTSNRPLEDWGKLLGDVPSATAILDRFLHHAEIVQITGKSYRLRNAARPGKEGMEEPKPANAPTGSDSRRSRTKTSHSAHRVGRGVGRFKTSHSAHRLGGRGTTRKLSRRQATARAGARKISRPSAVVRARIPKEGKRPVNNWD